MSAVASKTQILQYVRKYTLGLLLLSTCECDPQSCCQAYQVKCDICIIALRICMAAARSYVFHMVYTAIWYAIQPIPNRMHLAQPIPYLYYLI